jgi:hypothetical protein
MLAIFFGKLTAGFVIAGFDPAIHPLGEKDL